MATINYVDDAYFNAYITEILTELKTWIDTGIIILQEPRSN